MGMLLINCDGRPCRAFTQNPSGREPFDQETYHIMDVVLRDPKNRNSVGLKSNGTAGQEEVWRRLVDADAKNHIMCAWTSKDAPSSGGLGASGEHIAADGIVKGHAYS